MTVTVELTIGETLKLWRDRVGLSQKQLGAAIELGRTTVIRYEADTALPKWKDVQAWAALCGEDAEILRPAWDYARMSGCIHGWSPYEQLSLAGGAFDSHDLAHVARNTRGQWAQDAA